MTLHRVYGKITKSTQLEDGTLQVEGVASSEAKDSQGEVVKASAIKAALPEYMRFPALREMHQPLAAGKTIAADVAEDGCTYITAKVVDPVAIAKCKEGVYAGFSIGGTVPPGGRSKDNPKVIEQIQLVEISLVDRPANPEAVFTLIKLDAPKEDPITKTDPPAPATTEPVKTEPPKPGATTVARKGMGHVQWIAELLDSGARCASDMRWEADVEGDGSDLPAKVKGWVSDGCALLRAVAEEETSELIAAKGTESVTLLAAPGILKKSERVATWLRAVIAAVGAKAPELPELVDLRKRVEEAEGATKLAGEALKKVTVERNDLHKKHADATLALKAKGMPRDSKFVESVAKVEALEAALEAAQAETQDVCSKTNDALKKVMDERDEFKKQRDQFETALSVNADEAKKRLEDVVEDRDGLQKQLAEKVTALAKAEVALKTKGALKAVPVDKVRDVDPIEKDMNAPPEGTPARALYELKKVQARGGRPLTLGGLPPASQEQAR